MNVQARGLGRLGLVACAAVMLTLASGCDGDDGGTNGTPVATKTNTTKAAASATRTATRAAATPTNPSGGSTPSPTATPTMAFAGGSYSASFALPDSQTANLNLNVGGDGQATGTLELVDGGGASAAVEGELSRGLAISVGLVNLSGGINVANGTFHFPGFIAAPDGDIPFDISGTLPSAGGEGGEVTLMVNGQTYTTPLHAGSGPTPLPTAAPTPAGECTGGVVHLTFSNVSVDANPNQTLVPFDMTKNTGSSLSSAAFSVGVGKCPVEVGGVTRVFGIALYLGAQTFEPGLSVSLEDTGILANRVTYAEGTVGPTLKTWRSKGGTLTIDTVAGTSVTFHVTGAHMEPGPAFPFGPPAIGSFDLDATGTVTVMVF